MTTPIATVVRAVDDEPLLTRLAARMEPAMRRAFLAAVHGAAGVIDLGGLVDALRTGQVSQVEAAAQLDRLDANLRRQLLPVLGRTFAVGAQVGIDALGAAGLGIRFDLRNPAALAWVQAHGAELVTNVTDGTRAGIRALVEVSFREGRAPAQLAREIRELIGLLPRQATAVERFRERLREEGVAEDAVARRAGRYAEAQLRSRSLMIARTETLEASNAGQQDLWQAARAQGLLDPAETRRVWLVSRDDRLDVEICEPLDEAEAPLDGAFPGGYMRPPAHPNCFVPDTRIVGVGRAVVGLKTGYSGPIVRLETRRGYRLTVTPNHPILTPRGWVAAGRLSEGDDVLSERRRFHGRLACWAPENEHGPTAIKQVVDAFRANGFRQIKIGRDDLHGDAIWADCEIEIVGADRILRDRPHTNLRERDAQRLFVAPDATQPIRPKACGQTKTRQWDHASARGGPRRAALALDLRSVFLERSPLQEFGLALAARGNARVYQSGANGGARYAEPVGDRLFGRAGDVGGYDGGGINILVPSGAVLDDPRADDAPLAQPSINDATGASLSRDLLIGQSGAIETDQLVAVNMTTWHGHLYDLQTLDGFILAEGIVVSNCRCAVGLTFTG